MPSRQILLRVALAITTSLAGISCTSETDPWIRGYLSVESALKIPIGPQLEIDRREILITSGINYVVTRSDSVVVEGHRPGVLEPLMVDFLPVEVIGEVSTNQIRVSRIRYLEEDRDENTDRVRNTGQTFEGVVYGLVGSRRRGGVQQALILWDGSENYELEILPGAQLTGPDGTRGSVFSNLGHNVYRAVGVVQHFEAGPVLRAATLTFVHEASDADRSGSPGVSGKYSTDRAP